MIFLNIVTLSCIFLSFAANSFDNIDTIKNLETRQEKALFPQPNKVVWGKEHFALTKNTALLYNTEAAGNVAQYFSDFIQPATGFIPQLINKNSSKNNRKTVVNFIDFSLISSSSASKVKEGSYKLIVTPQKITVMANSEVGLFYGAQTLRQLLPAEIEIKTPINQSSWLINTVKINDSPRFSHRGMHLDVSRHFFDVNFVKRYIDWLAFHKMNVFQWHLTDDQGWRIEIKSMPELTRVGSQRKQTVVGHTYDYQSLFDKTPHGGFYTQAQIKEVVAYAKTRHIEVIPEIDVPGHSSAILASYPQYSCHQKPVDVVERFGIFENVLCPTEETFEMLENIYQEVSELFPSKYIHIGGDEVIKKQWLESEFVQKLMREHEINTPEEVQSYFIKRVSHIISKLDKTLIGWDEIMEGGIADNAVIMSWRGTKGGITASKKGHDAIMSPYQYTYLDAYQSRSIDEPKAIHGFLPLKQVYDYEPVPHDLPKEYAKHILGVQGALWTEYIKTSRHAEYMLFPRLSALSEVMWTEPEQKNWQRYSSNISQLLNRYRQMGLNPSDSVFNANANTKIFNLISVEKSGKTTLVDESMSSELEVSLTSNVDNQVVFYREYIPSFAKYTGKVLDSADSLTKKSSEFKKYHQPIKVNSPKTFQVTTQKPEGGKYFGNRLLTVAPHKALGKKITFVNEPKSGRDRILDGVMAYDQYYNVEDFAVFYDEDLDATIDLMKVTPFNQVVMGIDTGKHRQLHPPKLIKVFGSNDAKRWQLLTKLESENISHPYVNIQFTEVEYRFIRVFAENSKNSKDIQIPKLPLYVDEIVVY